MKNTNASLLDNITFTSDTSYGDQGGYRRPSNQRRNRWSAPQASPASQGDAPLLGRNRVDQQGNERAITESIAQELETSMFSIYGTSMRDINDEIADQDIGRFRDNDGTWMGPYVRFVQKLADGQPLRERSDGQGTTNRTSFAAGFPSTQPHTMLIDIDMRMIKRIQRNEHGYPFGCGFPLNNMTLDSVGRFCAALMLPGPDNRWVTVGTVNNLRGEGKLAMIFIHRPDLLPAPDSRGRVRLVMRNYWAIERDRLTRMLEDENGEVRLMDIGEALPASNFNPVEAISGAQRHEAPEASQSLDGLRITEQQASVRSGRRQSQANRQASGSTRTAAQYAPSPLDDIQF